LSCWIHQSEKRTTLSKKRNNSSIRKRISSFYKKQESDTTKERFKSRSWSFRKVKWINASIVWIPYHTVVQFLNTPLVGLITTTEPLEEVWGISKKKKSLKRTLKMSQQLSIKIKRKKGGFLGFIDKIFTKKLSSSKSSPACLHSKNTSLKNQNNQKIQEDFKSLLRGFPVRGRSFMYNKSIIHQISTRNCPEFCREIRVVWENQGRNGN